MPQQHCYRQLRADVSPAMDTSLRVTRSGLSSLYRTRRDHRVAAYWRIQMAMAHRHHRRRSKTISSAAGTICTSESGQRQVPPHATAANPRIPSIREHISLAGQHATQLYPPFKLFVRYVGRTARAGRQRPLTVARTEPLRPGSRVEALHDRLHQLAGTYIHAVGLCAR